MDSKGDTSAESEKKEKKHETVAERRGGSIPPVSTGSHKGHEHSEHSTKSPSGKHRTTSKTPREDKSHHHDAEDTPAETPTDDKDDEEGGGDDADKKKSSHHHHHRKKAEHRTPDGFQPPKTPKTRKEDEQGPESDAHAEPAASESSSAAEPAEPSEAANETQSEDTRSCDSKADEPKDGQDEKGESADGSGKETKLSKRLGGVKRKGLFNSINLRNWRKSSKNAEDGEASHDEDAQQDSSENLEEVPMESPNNSGRRSKYKTLFGKYNKRESGSEMEITRRSSATINPDEKTSFVVKTTEGDEGESAAPSAAAAATCSGASLSCGQESDDSDDGDSLEKEEKMRRRVLREIIETEESYVNDLRIIVDVIIANMQSKKVLDQNQIAGLFTGIEVLRNFNSFLLKKLKEGEPVGKSFEVMASFMKGYVQFCVNVPKAEESLKQYSKDSNFRAFLAELSAMPEMHQLGVGDFLMKPVQRLCKYPLLLRELISHTPEDSPDYPSLLNALNEIQKTVAAVNEGKRTDEEHRKVITIFNKLEGFDDRAKFIIPSRRFVHEETLTELLANGTEQEMHYIFFNDLIVRCKQHAGRYTLKSYIPQDVLLVTPISLPLQTRKVANANKPMFLFDIVHAGVDKFTIVCESEQERTRLLDIASGNIANASSGNNISLTSKSTKDLMEMYSLQPRSRPPPSVEEPEPPGTVVFSVSCSSCGESIRFISFDRDSENWPDITDRVARKFGLTSVGCFALCKHGSDSAVTSVQDLCKFVHECSSDPQFDLVLAG